MKHRYLQHLRLFLAPRGSRREELVRKAINGFRSVEHKIKHRLERKKQYDLSVVIVFYNMKREAARTLYSLSRNYQLLGEEISYDYGYDLENFEDHKCYCGQDNCVGYIVSDVHWPKLRRKFDLSIIWPFGNCPDHMNDHVVVHFRSRKKKGLNKDRGNGSQ